MGQRISIQKARTILGEFGKNLSDEKITQLLDYLYTIAEIEVENIRSMKFQSTQRSEDTEDDYNNTNA